MSNLKSRLRFSAAIAVLMGAPQLASGQSRLWLTLFSILVVSMSILYLIGADYV